VAKFWVHVADVRQFLESSEWGSFYILTCFYIY
jgi:hypothetical protein